MAAVIWSSRRSQGEDVSFLDAIDVPLEDIEWFGDPQDEAPQDAPGPKMPRPASAGGVGRGARATRSSGR
jgi:hypothetical protein